MSLFLLGKLRDAAKIRCRDLRKKQTPAEKKLWSILRNRNYCGYKFNRQHPLFHDLDGKETFLIADFYCHELRLVIELDGASHTHRAEHDAHRDQTMFHLGLNILRFENTTIFEKPHMILQAIDAIHSSLLHAPPE